MNEYSTTKTNVDVIIFSGQSNMQGQSEALSENEVVERAFEYKYLDDSLSPLKNPVGEDIRYSGKGGEPFTHITDQKKWLSDHVLGSACYGHTNLVPSFARAYIQKTQTPIIAVHAAKGSTKIEEWLPGSDGYSALVKKSISAIKKVEKQYKIRRILFVWLQGESDAIYGTTKNEYIERIKLLAHALKSELGIDYFGIIRVGAFTNDERDMQIISAQDEICREDSFFLMLTDIALELKTDPSMMNPKVRGHYSAKGLEKLGGAAGASFAELLS